MSAPINQLIDSVMRCTKCNSPMNVGCHCWDKNRLERKLVDETVKAISDTETYDELLAALDRIVKKYKKL